VQDLHFRLRERVRLSLLSFIEVQYAIGSQTNISQANQDGEGTGLVGEDS